MLHSVIKSKKEWFDRNPSGRILNRFSADIGQVDQIIFVTGQICLDIVSAEILVLITISYISPYLMVPCLIVIVFYWKLGLYFKSPLSRLRQLESVTRSPVFTDLSQAISGVIIIRIYHKVKMFLNNFMEKLNTTCKVEETFHWGNRVLGYTLDSCCHVFSFICLTILIFYDTDSGGLLGLGITQLINFSGEAQFLVRQYLYFDQIIIAVERIDQYCHLEAEPDSVLDKDKQLQKIWPSKGQIEFKNVQMKYNELNDDFILKNVSFVIEGGAKVGCVGRTGAGKSSLIQVLFRMAYPTDTSEITIDNININDIGLKLLRRSIAIIPQTSVTFVGSIKYNLDPIGTCNEDQLWEVLKEVGLDKKVEKLKNGLDEIVAFKQSVFSVGQKQLLCLARAILRKAKIVILDEATANVDFETDEFVQQKIKEKFANCTVFTIAHRLSTIIDYDKILVLDKGKVVEYDTPYNLLVNDVKDKTITKKGIFSGLVKDTGKASADSLFEKTYECYLQQQSKTEQ